MTMDKLTQLIRENAALRHEVEQYQNSIIRMGDIMEAVVNALRGAPPDDCSWSTHDLAELAAKAAAVANAHLRPVRHADFNAAIGAWHAVQAETARDAAEMEALRGAYGH